MSSSLLVVQFAVLLLANLLSADYTVNVCLLVIRYLSTLSYSSFVALCGNRNEELISFSPRIIIDVETQNDVTDVQILVLILIYTAPRGLCQLKSFFIGSIVGGSVFFNYNLSSVNHLPVPVHRSMSQHQL